MHHHLGGHLEYALRTATACILGEPIRFGFDWRLSGNVIINQPTPVALTPSFSDPTAPPLSHYVLAGRPRTLARAWSRDQPRPLSSFLPDSKFQVFMLHHHNVTRGWSNEVASGHNAAGPDDDGDNDGADHTNHKTGGINGSNYTEPEEVEPEGHASSSPGKRLPYRDNYALLDAIRESRRKKPQASRRKTHQLSAPSKLKLPLPATPSRRRAIFVP